MVSLDHGQEFHLEAPSLWNQDIFMQVNITESVETIIAYSNGDDFLADLVEYETVFTDDFRNVVKFSLNGEIDFAFSYFGEPELDSEKIYRQIFNFHTWLASE